MTKGSNVFGIVVGKILLFDLDFKNPLSGVVYCTHCIWTNLEYLGTILIILNNLGFFFS
jgi:hypothetical protein